MCPMGFIPFDQFIKDCVSNLRQITKNKMHFQDKPSRNRSYHQEFLMDAKILSRFRDIHEARFRAKTDK